MSQSTAFNSVYAFSVGATLVWFLCHAQRRALDPVTELPMSLSPHNSMDLAMSLEFELTIFVSDDDHSWSDAHRFPDRPDTLTVRALMREAQERFLDLYEAEPNDTRVGLEYIDLEQEPSSTFVDMS